MDGLEDHPLTEAHRYARLAEEAAQIGHWQQAVDRHTRAAAHFRACVERTASRDAHETLLLLEDHHLHEAKRIRSRLMGGRHERPRAATDGVAAQPAAHVATEAVSRPGVPAAAAALPPSASARTLPPTPKALMERIHRKLYRAFDGFRGDLQSLQALRELAGAGQPPTESAVPELRGVEDAAALRALIGVLRSENAMLEACIQSNLAQAAKVGDALVRFQDAFKARSQEFVRTLETCTRGVSGGDDTGAAGSEMMVPAEKLERERERLQKQVVALRASLGEEVSLREKQTNLLEAYQKKLQALKEREHQARRGPVPPPGLPPGPQGARRSGGPPPPPPTASGRPPSHPQ